MKKTKFLVLAVLAAMFVGCQSEEPEQISGNDRPGPTGDTRIIIEGEGMLDTQSRSSDGRVDFTGGYATGAGLYNGSDRPMVAAYPNAGYEVSYFYGGPVSEPKKYDYAQNQSSTFNVDLGGQDHTFHCGFKEKKRTLTVNAGSGGKVTPSGTKEYQVEKAINITATPNSGYEFSGWSITGGDVTIANSNSSSTTATLHNSNSTITAKFEKEVPKEYSNVRVSFNSNFSATVTASGTEFNGDNFFTGQSGTFKVLKGGTVTIRVMRGTITFDGVEYPMAGVDNINVWGNTSIITSVTNTFNVTFTANDSNISVNIHCYTGGNIN